MLFRSRAFRLHTLKHVRYLWFFKTGCGDDSSELAHNSSNGSYKGYTAQMLGIQPVREIHYNRVSCIFWRLSSLLRHISCERRIILYPQHSAQINCRLISKALSTIKISPVGNRLIARLVHITRGHRTLNEADRPMFSVSCHVLCSKL